ncbi:MAG: alkaline phosphatase family protein [Deltaproteobacteria bacterium]|jgi:predicted AlkP superfamily phosphohydrolase/phosphomutase|nr:alkaline phosphatase family protein [Deltaproteobacteria bacterium]
MVRAKRVALVGFDCAIPKRLEALMAEGVLPNFSQFKKEGSYLTQGYNLPTVTPPSWASIATGAFPRTHGVEDYYYYVEGRSLEHKKTVQGFGSAILKAETIWDRWDQAGKKCLVVNYPMSWPSQMKNGIMVMGQGMSPAEFRFMEPGNAHREFLAAESVISTEIYSQGTRIVFDKPRGWQNLPQGHDWAAFTAEVDFRESVWPLEKVTWHGLVWDSAGRGFDRLALAPEKDFEKAFFTLAPGQWSDPVELDFPIREDLRIEKGVFRAKLMELSDDAESFRLYLSGISGRTGFVEPPQAAQGIDFSGQIVANDIGLVSLIGGIIDPPTVVELARYHSQWLTKTATSLLLNNPDWDLFYMHSHTIDWFYHGFLTDMDSSDPVIRKRARDMEREIYRIEDAFLGSLLEHFGPEDLVCLCSDHGATPTGPIFNTAEALKVKGLCSYEKQKSPNYWDIYEQSEGFDYVLDVSKSAAIPQKYMFVYVNTEKYPGGFVKEDDYENVREDIIDALLDYRHPETGKRPVLLALKKEDAKVLGMGGVQSGDVVYALKPEYMAEHGYGLPTGESGCGSLKNILLFKGPTIKKDFVYDRPRWLADIVPTICAATGGPLPADVEGAVIYQIFKDFSWE